jgi:hypothetical protein
MHEAAGDTVASQRRAPLRALAGMAVAGLAALIVEMARWV